MEFIELHQSSVFVLHVLSAFLLDTHKNVRIKCFHFADEETEEFSA